MLNFRDLGGYKTKSGKIIKKGLLFRSGQILDLEVLKKLKIKICVDFRTEEERKRYSQKLPEQIKYFHFDVLKDAENSINPVVLQKMIKTPNEANSVLGGGKIEEFYEKAYRQIITLKSAQKAFSAFFNLIMDKNNLPLIFYCSTGKDRAGFASACFLKFMEVPEETIYEDYLKSNDSVFKAFKKEIEDFVSNGGDISIIKALLGVKEKYLQSAFEEMEKIYGKIEDYFHKAFGIDYKNQDKLKENFLN